MLRFLRFVFILAYCVPGTWQWGDEWGPQWTPNGPNVPPLVDLGDPGEPLLPGTTALKQSGH